MAPVAVPRRDGHGRPGRDRARERERQPRAPRYSPIPRCPRFLMATARVRPPAPSTIFAFSEM